MKNDIFLRYCSFRFCRQNLRVKKKTIVDQETYCDSLFLPRHPLFNLCCSYISDLWRSLPLKTALVFLFRRAKLVLIYWLFHILAIWSFLGCFVPDITIDPLIFVSILDYFQAQTFIVKQTERGRQIKLLMY